MLTFSQKRGAITHVAIIKDNQRALEMAYELLKAPRKLVLEPREIQLGSVASEVLSFKHVMTRAARYGCLEMLQWMAKMATKERVWWVWEEDLTAHALYRRDFTVMSYLKDEFPSETTRVPYQFLQAIRDDDLELAKWYYEHECHLGSEESFEWRYVMDHAVSLEILQLMHAHREVRCATRVMDRAAKLGDLEMVKFLHKNRDEGCTTDTMSSAAAKGHVEIVRNGHLETVRFLHEYRSEGCTKSAMDHAPENGHLEIVKFLHENRSEGCTKNAMDMAVRCGHSGGQFPERGPK